MSFWEFNCACGGYDAFHGSPPEPSAADQAPSRAQYYAALGIHDPDA